MPRFEYYDDKERELVEQYITLFRASIAAEIEYGRPSMYEPIAQKAVKACEALGVYYQDKFTCQHPQAAEHRKSG